MSKYFPAIPGTEDQRGFLSFVKEAFEKGLGNIGQKNDEGRYLDEWITRRTLIDELQNSGILNTYITNTISVGLSLNDPVDKYIVSGAITVDGSGLVTVYSESGMTDDLDDKIAGLSKGQTVDLVPASEHTITITASSYLKLPSPTWVLSGYRIATFQCMGGDICIMRTHEANRS